MLKKIGGLARAIAVILAVVAAVVTIPALDVTTLLIVLGLLAGLAYGEGEQIGLIVVALVLPVVASVLTPLQAVGGQLGAIAANLAVVAASAVATVLALRMADVVKGDLMGLTAK